ncbi:hypothetical protein Goklo_013723 [Gossypium klotzschianum]|uniref:RNase H type-1 domain-containing protein n=1 Tax=Gossypium klotzschianum TaxID=34286 RepID=A0A7J8U585_9ROSI|nr:hypothetical protein [Gossypium klotzschianum]
MDLQPKQFPIRQNSGIYVVLNTDDVVHSVSGLSATGGVIRNNKGEWILGYNCCLGKCFAATVELWGLLDGLFIIQKQGYNKEVQQVLASEETWSLTYVPRETNRVADALTKMALSSVYSLRIFEVPPIRIKEILQEDNFVDNSLINHPM